MNTLRLSLVVPVYNVASYLERCLESLAALDPSADEILVVDDGSTDGCPGILAKWGARLPAMRVIRQENGGLSAARNTALGVARGRFLAFVDSDDFVSPDAYVDAMRLAEAEDLDMVLLNANYHFEGREPDYAIYADVAPTCVIPGREWLRQRLRAGRMPHMVWMHLYRREFIEAHGFRFIPNLIHEDVIWTTRALMAATRVRYTGHVAVHYRIPLRQFSPEQAQRRLKKIVESSIYNAEVLAEMTTGLAHDPELQALLSDHLVDGALSVFHKLPKMPDRRVAAATLHHLRTSGFLALLWRHARTSAHRRRIARHWLRSWLVSSGP